MSGVKEEHKMNCIERVSFAIVNSMETLFNRLGECVATHPKRFIAGCLALTVISSLGFLNFRLESRMEKLWLPQGSDFVRTLEWQKENFPQDQRFEMILYEAENVLTAQYVKEMYRIHEQVSSIVVTDDQGRVYTQADLCFRIPALGGKQREELLRIKAQMFPERDPTEEIDWSLAFDKPTYYRFYVGMPTACMELGILEIWGYDTDKLEALTDQQIINDINTANMSETFSQPENFTRYLGGVERNASGHIIAATTAITYIVMEVERSRLNSTHIDSSAGLADVVDPELYQWEECFVNVLANASGRPQGLGVFYKAQRSFSEISGETIMSDVLFLTIGTATLFIYVQLMLGRFNMVENRPVLSVIGIFSTYLATTVSFGLCSALGLIYSPVHTILPLLLIGLGVDDMFVLVQCWNNLNNQERQLAMEKRVGRALRHAGVAITVTSLTDFAAFFIGATTVLPALRSFCIYCAVGVMVLYVFQCTFFLAWFILDQRRLEDHRNGLVWCYKHKDWTPNQCSQKDFCQTFFDKIYSKVLLMKPVKVLVGLVTLTLLGTSIWGVTNLRQDFEPMLFLPPSSYLSQFVTRALAAYPEVGNRGTVYLGALNYSQELYKVGELTAAMEGSQYVAEVNSWYDHMAEYTFKDTGEDIRGKALNESFFREALSTFLFSPVGFVYQTYFHFDGNLTIAQPSPAVTASKFDYRHTFLNGRDEEIAAMDEVKFLVESVGFSDTAAATSQEYSSYETNKMILVELTRNLIMAMAAVFIMTLVLLANLPASLCVLLSVTLTLLNVMALMTWWGLTVDIITCINLVLCIGLCVDYSSHIALHFMQVRGTRQERAQAAVRDMGPPVMNGAFSTFLSLSFLAFSNSHVFLSFFKIFFGVFIYGVFHGLVFLPVLLSLVGPAPYTVKLPPSEPSTQDPAISSTSEPSVKIFLKDSDTQQTYVAVPLE